MLIFKLDGQTELVIGKVLILPKANGDGCRGGTVALASRHICDVLEGVLVLLPHILHHHLVVLDGCRPEVRHPLHIFQVGNIGGLVLLGFLLVGLLLLLGLLDASYDRADLHVGSLVLRQKFGVVCDFALDDLITLLQEGKLLLAELSFESFLLSFEEVVDLGTFVGEHVEHLETVLHLRGHLLDHLDHLLFDFAFFLLKLQEVFFSRHY